MSSAKKSVIAGEYILSVLDNGSIEVCRSSDNTKFENVKEALRQIAEQEDFEFDPKWNTRQFGNKLISFIGGDGANTTPDAPKGNKYTIEISLWAKGVQLLDVTEEEKDELSEGNLNDVFYDWASKYDYDFYYERQFICPDTEYFELVVKDEEDNVVYVSDYAHHPEELRQCAISMKELYAGSKVTAIFQPHLYTRTRDFYKEFADSLSLFDEVYLVDIYPARELPIEGVTSQLIADNMKSGICKAVISLDQVPEVVERIKADTDVLVTVGAGDLENYVPKIVDILKTK